MEQVLDFFLRKSFEKHKGYWENCTHTEAVIQKRFIAYLNMQPDSFSLFWTEPYFLLGVWLFY